MSPAEISYRVRQAAKVNVQRAGLLVARESSTPNLSVRSQSFVSASAIRESGLYLQRADAVVEGRIGIFALEDCRLGPIPDWNRDPKTARKAPLEFGKTLNYRDPSRVGDIKYLWEPNRHLQLVALAQAYKLTKENRYLEVLRRHLDSWFEQCPYMLGPNWTSSLELGIRLINWSIVWQLIGGPDSPLFVGEIGQAFQQRWLQSIYQHAHFIRGHYSRFSSANNHLIGEAAGVFVAAVTWPHWKRMRVWREDARNILEEEVQLQNTADGVNREQATSYQQFVLDFLILAGLAGRANGVEFSRAYWKRVEVMLEFIVSIMDVRGNVPMMGDADDGFVVRLSPEPNWCPYKSLLVTGAVLFNRPGFMVKAVSLDDKTRWLLGPRVEEFRSINRNHERLPVRQAFREGGYYILGADFETPGEARLVVDAGPLGYQSIAAHGHADALAFTLSIGGYEFLIDPGTYAYHTNPKWRKYFRGTAAHNTVVVDGEDQSVIGGNFIWLRHAGAECEQWASSMDLDYFRGSHDGYSRLEDPVIHRREIRFVKPERKIEITDTVICSGSHTVECMWHFSEDCQVEKHDDLVVARHGGCALKMRSTEGSFQTLLLRGDEARPGGWVSRRFDVKVPTTTVILRSVIRGTTVLNTVMNWSQLDHDLHRKHCLLDDGLGHSFVQTISGKEAART